MKTFKLSTRSRECLVDITREVIRAVAESGTGEGVCIVFIPHTTAAATINEHADPDVARDIVSFLAQAVPNRGFLHGEGNSDAHVKASLFGPSLTIPISEGRLALGTWQGIYFAEFDGPRTRKYHVTILGESR
jgi:secondary thiamine-phosphate synthase enzyme